MYIFHKIEQIRFQGFSLTHQTRLSCVLCIILFVGCIDQKMTVIVKNLRKWPKLLNDLTKIGRNQWLKIQAESQNTGQSSRLLQYYLYHTSWARRFDISWIWILYNVWNHIITYSFLNFEVKNLKIMDERPSPKISWFFKTCKRWSQSAAWFLNNSMKSARICVATQIYSGISDHSNLHGLCWLPQISQSKEKLIFVILFAVNE